MQDKSNELLSGEDINKAIMECLSCANIAECGEEEKPIYTDGQGNCINWVNGIAE